MNKFTASNNSYDLEEDELYGKMNDDRKVVAVSPNREVEGGIGNYLGALYQDTGEIPEKVEDNEIGYYQFDTHQEAAKFAAKAKLQNLNVNLTEFAPTEEEFNNAKETEDRLGLDSMELDFGGLDNDNDLKL